MSSSAHKSKPKPETGAETKANNKFRGIYGHGRASGQPVGPSAESLNKATAGRKRKIDDPPVSSSSSSSSSSASESACNDSVPRRASKRVKKEVAAAQVQAEQDSDETLPAVLLQSEPFRAFYHPQRGVLVACKDLLALHGKPGNTVTRTLQNLGLPEAMACRAKQMYWDDDKDQFQVTGQAMGALTFAGVESLIQRISDVPDAHRQKVYPRADKLHAKLRKTWLPQLDQHALDQYPLEHKLWCWSWSNKVDKVETGSSGEGKDEKKDEDKDEDEFEPSTRGRRKKKRRTAPKSRSRKGELDRKAADAKSANSTKSDDNKAQVDGGGGGDGDKDKNNKGELRAANRDMIPYFTRRRAQALEAIVLDAADRDVAMVAEVIVALAAPLISSNNKPEPKVAAAEPAELPLPIQASVVLQLPSHPPQILVPIPIPTPTPIQASVVLPLPSPPPQIQLPMPEAALQIHQLQAQPPPEAEQGQDHRVPMDVDGDDDDDEDVVVQIEPRPDDDMTIKTGQAADIPFDDDMDSILESVGDHLVGRLTLPQPQPQPLEPWSASES